MEAYIDKSALRQLANMFTFMIKKRTAEGLDKDGKPFKPYSTKPFKMPSGAATKRAKKILMNKGELSYFKTVGGKLWIVVKSGYLGYKQSVYAQTSYKGVPNLMLTGQMLGAFAPIVYSESGFSLGFTRAEEAKKAYWNILKGRDFIGMTDKELQSPEIIELLTKSIRFR